MSDQSDPPSWGSQPPGGAPPPPPPPPSDQGWAQQGQQGYAQQGYGQPGPYSGDPQAGYGHQGGLAYASWIQRVGATIVDGLVLIPGYIIVFIGLAIVGASATTTTDPTTGQVTTTGANPVGFVVVGLGYLAMIAIAIWNQYVRQGQTGWSLGKQALGIRLLKEDTGQPMGGLLCFVRAIVHVVDSIPCLIGYLWPLWDAKKQTFADKIMGTVVVQQRKS
jgi:uncharacterized RDD family membrane protein YckC